MLRLANIRKTYTVGANQLQVLRGIDLAVEKGEIVSIMGSSGSGKSTLLNVLGLLDNYDEGEYHLDRQLVRGLSEARAAIEGLHGTTLDGRTIRVDSAKERRAQASSPGGFGRPRRGGR